VSGATAEYGVKVEAVSGGKLVAAGFSLNALAGPDGTESAFGVRADEFFIVNPSNGASVIPFIVSGGICYMRGAVIEAASIGGSRLENNTISTNKIIVGAATAAASSTQTHTVTTPSSASSWSRVDALTSFTSTGAPVVVQCVIETILGDSSGFGVTLGSTVGHATFTQTLVVDGVDRESIIYTDKKCSFNGGNSRAVRSSAVVHWRGVLSVGSHSFSLRTAVQFHTDAGGLISTTGSFVVSTATIIQENKV
jgi:hypothetical protein